MAPDHPAIQPLDASVLDRVLALNNAFAEETSPLTAERLVELVDIACYARGTADASAFLIAFDQDAAYDSPNFLWFRERYPRFVYIDRVVTAAAARGRGLARALYGDLARVARGQTQDILVCEVNSDPPNPGSDAFHRALGFSEVGSATLADRGKTVRYLLKPLKR
ncbi:MAG: GNAT family N-acetyltransferase [Alphaproteobacteria bacterium]|nr:MAG: GNAT family N-acetyltransferase [Alphaproteobacteria bacterium]